MARLLFAVHGMGEQGAGWATLALDALNEAARRYPFFGDRPSPFVLVEAGADSFDLGPDRVAVVPVSYDGVFETWRQQLGRSVEELRAFTQAGELALPGQGLLFHWLDTAPEDERAFFWSHALDVLLYRYTHKAGEVRVRVMQQIAQALTTAMQDGTPVQASVLAHSLGTAVASDSLSVLGTTPLGEPPSRAFVQPRLFHVLFMLANVSRLLESDEPVYNGIVKPGTAGADAYADVYVSAYHTLDPICAVCPFAPVGWGDSYAAVRLSHVRSFNVHALEHYLEAPQVHVPLLNSQLGQVVSREEYEAAVAQDLMLEGPPCVEESVEFVQRGVELVTLFRNRSVVEMAIAASQFLALARRMQQACVGIAGMIVLLLWACPLHAQSAVRADCDAEVVLAMDRTDLPTAWQNRHPATVFARTAADRAAGRWPDVFAAEQSRFRRESTLPASQKAAFLRQMDALVSEVSRVFTDPDSAALAATTTGVQTTRFTLRKPGGIGFDDAYTLFPETPDAIVVDARTPAEERRDLCWHAITLEMLLTAYGEQARQIARGALEKLVAQWEAFNTDGYSLYPWELLANSLGARRTQLAPPRRQWVLLHPSAGVGVTGWPPGSFRRMDVLALEVTGLLVYRSDRRNYRGASLLLTLPAQGGPGGGLLVHLNRTLRAGYVFRLATHDPVSSGGFVVSLDLYKALTDVPRPLQMLQARAEAIEVR